MKQFADKLIAEGHLILGGKRHSDDTYRVKVKLPHPAALISTAPRNKSDLLPVAEGLALLQQRLGYVSSTRLLSVVRQYEQPGLQPLLHGPHLPDATILLLSDASIHPEVRRLAAQSSRPHFSIPDRSRCAEPYALIHIDLQSVGIISYYGDTFCLVIVDDHSRTKHTFALKRKNDVLSALERFIQQTIRPNKHHIHAIRLDNDGETKSALSDKFFSKLSHTSPSCKGTHPFLLLPLLFRLPQRLLLSRRHCQFLHRKPRRPMPQHNLE